MSVRSLVASRFKKQMRPLRSLNVMDEEITFIPLEPTDENTAFWNRLIDACRKERWRHAVMIDGVISTARKDFKPPMYLVDDRSRNGRMLYLIHDWIAKFYFGSKPNVSDQAGRPLCGKKAFNTLRRELLADGVNLDDYMLSSSEYGEEIKTSIRYAIKLCSPLYASQEKDKAPIWRNAHHIDFHSSYPAGLANTHPEFRPTLERLFAMRKTADIEQKAVLDMSIGFFQSRFVPRRPFGLANLARDAIEDNYQRVEHLHQSLVKAGRVPLLWNTDGIWYTGAIFHGPGEGDKLGDWRHDYTNAILRIKSVKAYEFMYTDPNGQLLYKPVLSGTILLDRIKPRSEWSWGDIFQSDIQVWTVDPNDEEKIIKT